MAKIELSAFVYKHGSSNRKGDSGLKNLSDDETFYYKFGDNFVKLSKRTEYPTFYCYESEGMLTFGYGASDISINSGFDEYLRCSYDFYSASIKIERDYACTLPLFYYADDNCFAVADSLGTLIDTLMSNNIGLEFDEDQLFNLLVKVDIGDSTLFGGIKMLTGPQKIIWDNGLKINTPNMHNIRSRKNSSDPQDFKQALEEIINEYFDKVKHDKENLYFEWSGGLDSSTAPLLFASIDKIHPKLASISFDEGFGRTQHQKYMDMHRHTDCSLSSVKLDIKQHFPLARFETKDQYEPFYQYQEIYTEALNDLAALLELQGAKYIFTGVGGDELFENRVADLEQKFDYEDYEFINKDFWIKKIDVDFAHLQPQAVADSAFYANQSRNGIYLKHGIWPIAPLANARLYRFCQDLPILMRSNKNILRALFEAYDWPKSIYNPVQNEHFGRFFDDAMKSQYQSKFGAMFDKNSYLVRRGYVDLAKLTEVYKSGVYSENGSKQLFDIFRVMSAEVILGSVFGR